MTTTAPYGTWESPISAEIAATAGGGPDWVLLVDGQVWWTENRPGENGRATVLRAAPDQQPVAVLPAWCNARNRVQEYGGRPFTVAGATLIFTEWSDQRLYRVNPDGADAGHAVPLTAQPQQLHGWRYAEPTVAPGGAALWCVRETVTGDTPTDILRELVEVPLDGSAATDPAAVRVLAASHHFMTAPRPSPDGRHAAWIGWNHPAMPWDSTQLCVAQVGADGFTPPWVLAGGPREAVCQAEWDGPDALLVMTDPDGWWNLHRVGLDGSCRNLLPVSQELGGALWRPGQRWFAPLGSGRHAVLRGGRLAVLDEAGGLTEVPTGLEYWAATLCAENGQVACVAGGPRQSLATVTADLSSAATAPRPRQLSAQPAALPDPALLPRPVELMFATDCGSHVPAYVYPPTNPGYRAPDGERPPFLVHVHGGPTSRNYPVLDLEIAFFTSRGFGVVAPNYGGSSGYGRAFRERLHEQWGLVDVQDCAIVAQSLAAAGTADARRLVIRGGSAGGWTTAASLTAPGHPVYRCGTARYPILDLTTWGAEGGETHDFESQYLHTLVGPLPRNRERYAQRSPINQVQHLAEPILLLQGLDDQICPPAQARRLLAALTGRGVPHAYLAFDGEQHGFRRAETVAAALHAELSFYGQVLGFEPPGVRHLELSS